ncbi:MAG TPA: ABC transporter ATP-binding protein [Clostridiaceae bacterium]|nr:ABC transporter ATP-binding protein [Clostridiaceae bacterium]
MNTVIKVSNLHKTFKNGETEVHVLKGLDFNVEAGEFISIMGPSGCGKSTLLYLLGGLDYPTKGQIFINGEDLNKKKDRELSHMRRSDIGFVFQFYNLVHNLSVYENIALPLVMGGVSTSSFKNRIYEILDIVGLSDKKDNLPSQLSGGQQQRVAIARAVIVNPSIILADEPVGNLDSKNGQDVMKLFYEINQRYKISIVQVTHDPDMALYGSRLIRIKDGIIEKTEDIESRIIL